MRHVGHRLRDALEPFERQFIEQERQDDRGGEAHHQIEEIQHEGVAQRPQEVRCPEGLDEVLPAVVVGQRHLPRALYDAVALEGDLDVGHGDVLEDDEVGDGQGQQGIERPVLVHIEFEALAPVAPCISCLQRCRWSAHYSILQSIVRYMLGYIVLFSV